MKTQQGRVLTEQHRQAQARLSRTTVAQVLRLWPLLTQGGVSPESQRRWIDAVLVVLAAQRARSAALAAQYATVYRLVETGATDFVPVPAAALQRQAVETSLSVLAVVGYRREVAKQLGKNTRDLTDEELRLARLPGGLEQKLNANAAAAAMRHVQNGARETLEDVMTRDRRVVGHMRITDAAPCWFCAMLASRGPVYQDDSFQESNARFSGPGDQKVHDACGCMMVPMYGRMESPDELEALRRYQDYDRLWRANPSRLDFRRAYEGRSKPR